MNIKIAKELFENEKSVGQNKIHQLIRETNTTKDQYTKNAITAFHLLRVVDYTLYYYIVLYRGSVWLIKHNTSENVYDIKPIEQLDLPMSQIIVKIFTNQI